MRERDSADTASDDLARRVDEYNRDREAAERFLAQYGLDLDEVLAQQAREPAAPTAF